MSMYVCLIFVHFAFMCKLVPVFLAVKLTVTMPYTNWFAAISRGSRRQLYGQSLKMYRVLRRNAEEDAGDT